jgi:hypothetical protein
MSGDHNQYQKNQFPDTTKMMREWVGLTNNEITQCWIQKHDHDVGAIYAFACAIEARLREKNAYGWQSVSNPTEYLDELRGGKDE